LSPQTSRSSLNALLFRSGQVSNQCITICGALQLPLDHWSEVIGDPVITDAIRDRLEHSALKIHITGESYRGVKARKLASKKKDS
jgi:DNA replication protein DnaC